MLSSSWPDIDAVLELGPAAVVASRVTAMAEDFYEYHFPGKPIVPAVMQLSWLEHAVAVYVAYHTAGRYAAVLREMVRVTCLHTATPGDELHIEATLTQPFVAEQAEPGTLLAVSGQVARAGTRLLRARLLLEVVRYSDERPPWPRLAAALRIGSAAARKEEHAR